MFHILRREDPDDERFAEKLICENYEDIYKYCYRHLRDQTLAEDITQEVFLKFICSMERYREYGKRKNYLYVIASNAIKDHFKRASTLRETAEEQDGHSESRSGKEGAIDQIDRMLDRMQVMTALDELEAEEREMIIQRYYQDMRLKDIACVMDMPVSTVRYRLKQAESKLRDKLV